MKALIVANWKMYPPSFKEAKSLLEKTKKMAAPLKKITLVIAPPSIYLKDLAQGPRRASIAFAAQDAHYDVTGAHTGEISMGHVKDVKASHVIIGHAERRAKGETNEEVRKKVSASLTARLTPIVCIGESERGSGAEHFASVREQIRASLPDDVGKKLSKMIIAYEPVWAIGATKAIRPHDMHEMSIFIRKTLVEKYGSAGHGITILYGGAVDHINAADMLKNGDVTGLLIGRASVDIAAFKDVLKAVSDA